MSSPQATFLEDGSATVGDTDRDLLVGPTAHVTKRGVGLALGRLRSCPLRQVYLVPEVLALVLSLREGGAVDVLASRMSEPAAEYSLWMSCTMPACGAAASMAARPPWQRGGGA